MSDSTNGKIHFAETPCFRYAFLPDNGNILTIPLMAINELQGLYKHSPRTATGIVHHPAERLDHFCDQSNNAGRCIEFAFFLRSSRCVGLKEVFIYSADQVFLLEAFFVNQVDVINEVFNF